MPLWVDYQLWEAFRPKKKCIQLQIFYFPTLFRLFPHVHCTFRECTLTLTSDQATVTRKKASGNHTIAHHRATEGRFGDCSHPASSLSKGHQKMTLGTMCSLGWGPSRPQLAFPKLSQEKATLLPGLARTKTTLKADWEQGLTLRLEGKWVWHREGWGGPWLISIQICFQQAYGGHHCTFLWAETQLLQVACDLGLGVIGEKKRQCFSSHWQWNCIMQGGFCPWHHETTEARVGCVDPRIICDV